MFHFVALLIVFLLEVRGELPVSEDCPNVSVQKNFDVQKFMGKWYLQAHYPEISEPKSHCYIDELALLDDNTIEVHASKLHIRTRNEHKETFILKNTNEAKYELNIPRIEMDPPFPYWIISTDYKSYAIIWSCRELKLKPNKMSMRNLWLMTREKKASDDIMEKMHNIVIAQGLDDKYLEPTDNSNC